MCPLIDGRTCVCVCVCVTVETDAHNTALKNVALYAQLHYFLNFSQLLSCV